MAGTDKTRILFIRNGISAAFILLLAIAAVILFTVEIEVSSEVGLINTGCESRYIGVLLSESNDTEALETGDIFSFNQGGADFSFNIDSISQDETFRVLFLTPVSAAHEKLPVSSKITYGKRNLKLWNILFYN